MSHRAESAREAARNLRDRLNAEGRHEDAAIVQRVILNATATAATLQRTHTDNMRLRQQLGLPAFEVKE